MAPRNQKLRVDIEATDKASAKIEEVDRKQRKLDGEKATVSVDADTSDAQAGLDALEQRLQAMGLPSGPLGQLASPGGAVAALGAGLILAADHASNLALEAGNLASLTGDSAEEA